MAPSPASKAPSRDSRSSFPHVAGRPGDLGRVGVAEQPQPPVSHGPDVWPSGWAEGGEGLVPGGPLVWHVADGLRADRIVWMVIAVHVAVSGDGGGLLFPGAAGSLAGGHRAKSVDRPC